MRKRTSCLTEGLTSNLSRKTGVKGFGALEAVKLWRDHFWPLSALRTKIFFSFGVKLKKRPLKKRHEVWRESCRSASFLFNDLRTSCQSWPAASDWFSEEESTLKHVSVQQTTPTAPHSVKNRTVKVPAACSEPLRIKRVKIWGASLFPVPVDGEIRSEVMQWF